GLAESRDVEGLVPPVESQAACRDVEATGEHLGIDALPALPRPEASVVEASRARLADAGEHLPGLLRLVKLEPRLEQPFQLVRKPEEHPPRAGGTRVPR